MYSIKLNKSNFVWGSAGVTNYAVLLFHKGPPAADTPRWHKEHKEKKVTAKAKLNATYLNFGEPRSQGIACGN